MPVNILTLEKHLVIVLRQYARATGAPQLVMTNGELLERTKRMLQGAPHGNATPSIVALYQTHYSTPKEGTVQGHIDAHERACKAVAEALGVSVQVVAIAVADATATDSALKPGGGE